MLLKNIPILRIFDIVKAKEFYIDWLGFEIDFEHQLVPGTLYYIGIKKDNIEIHLRVVPKTQTFQKFNLLNVDRYWISTFGKF